MSAYKMHGNLAVTLSSSCRLYISSQTIISNIYISGSPKGWIRICYIITHGVQQDISVLEDIIVLALTFKLMMTNICNISIL